MFCSNCGKEIQDTAKFCNGCGNAVSGSKAQTSASSSSPIEKLSKLSPGKKKKIAIISGVAVVALVLIVVFINSMSLENRLEGTWYCAPEYNYLGGASGATYTFFSNGDLEYNRYIGKEDIDETRTYEWELTDDNRLYFRGDYYHYKDEWYFKDGKLYIDDWVYYPKDEWDYYCD